MWNGEIKPEVTSAQVPSTSLPLHPQHRASTSQTKVAACAPALTSSFQPSRKRKDLFPLCEETSWKATHQTSTYMSLASTQSHMHVPRS